MKKKQLYSAAVIASGCLWGLMGFFRRRMDTMGFDNTGVVLVRFGVTALLFALTILLSDPASIKIRLRDLWCFLGSGLCSLLFFTLCYFQAMTVMSLSTAAVLLYTAPCFVILMSALLFKERITARKLLAVALSILGCALVSGVVGSRGTITAAGLLFGLGAGFGYALYSIFGKLAFQRGYKSNTVNFYSCAFAAVGAGLIGGFRTPVGLMLSSGGNFAFVLFAALVTCYLPYLLYTYGLSGIEAGKASVMASVEPVVATLLGVLAYHEPLGLFGALGMALVLAAIVILELKRKEHV